MVSHQVDEKWKRAHGGRADENLRSAYPRLVRNPCLLVILIILVVGAILATVPVALGKNLSEEKREIDSRIAGLAEEIEGGRAREGVLTSEIQAATGKIDAIAVDIATMNEEVAALEGELAENRARLAELAELHRHQTWHLRLLRAQNVESQRRLEDRLIDLYTTEQPDAMAIMLGAGSLNELIEQIDLLNDIGRQDRRIATTLRTVKADLREARQETAATKKEQARVTDVVAEKTAAEREMRDTLIDREVVLFAARSDKQELLGQVSAERHGAEEDLGAMLAASAIVAARIQAVQSASASQAAASEASGIFGQSAVGGGSTPSASGLVWPVGGILTSGFGARWGRMHEGIDVAVPIGTSIVAAASGTVIYSGWLAGYGNLVVIDHGGGVATAYGHQSAIYVTAGPVLQGQAIGAIGSTGHSTGPHLHLEVRINGVPVDPLGYL